MGAHVGCIQKNHEDFALEEPNFGDKCLQDKSRGHLTFQVVALRGRRRDGRGIVAAGTNLVHSLEKKEVRIWFKAAARAKFPG